MSQAANHILIVDDEPQVRDLTRRALTAHGFQCDVVSDGEEAFHHVSKTSYDAVLTDLRMPRKHGHSLCMDLMELPNPPCVMVVTALTDPRLVRDLMMRGVKDVVQKPVNYDVLAMKLQAVIEQGRARQTKSTIGSPKKANLKKINLLQQVEASLVELTELGGDRLDRVFESSHELPDPPRAVREFIRRMAESEVTESDKSSDGSTSSHPARHSDRVTCFTTAIAVPVDRLWKRVGDPFKLALRDLSEGGVRLLHTRATNADYLALSWNATQMAGKQIRIVCTVRRCKPCGPFYDIGGQFVMAD